MSAPALHVAVYRSDEMPEPLSLDLIEQVLEEVAGRIGMTRVGDPHIVLERGHMLAWQLIAESHIYLEEAHGRRILEIASCKPFDLDAPAEVLGRLLGGTWRHELVYPLGEASPP